MEAPSYRQRRTVPVTVVIPACGRASLVDAAFASVAGGTVAPAEIILIDDGSPDDSRDAIAAVAQRWGARLIRQENAGPSAARNAGIVAASSPWIALLDSDDCWLPRKLEIQWTAIESAKRCGAAICNFRVLTDFGCFEETAFEFDAAYQLIPKRRVSAEAWELEMTAAGRALAESMFAQPSGLLIERDLALRIGGFDETLLRGEDHEFVLRLFAATRVISVENALVRYRVHPDSISKKNEVEMLTCCVEIADRVIARPERYPPGADVAMKRLKPALAFRAAAGLIKNGE
ncbi:MAG: glycosyltransferase, partial [Candidatus Eremiobacteraeota bacterium]|nr:glycosyltransferase [Candidatus Eremiobacteraeota bacterium]MBV8354184.1 glycosyltransferase [Candidatus Eremiobacteraeota bacterium]